MTPSQPKKINSVARAIAVLRLISQHGPISAADLTRRSGLAFATVQRILHTLSEEGVIRRRLSENTYEIPFTFIRRLVENRHSRALVDVATPLMAAATEELGHNTFIGEILSDSTMPLAETTLGVIRGLSSLDGQPKEAAVSPYGQQRSIVFGPLGLVQLAFQTDPIRTRHLDRLRIVGSADERAWIETDAFADTLSTIRRTGYASRHPDYAPEQFEDGSHVWSIAVPIMTRAQVYGGLGLGGREAERGQVQALHLIPRLRHYADLIAQGTEEMLSFDATSQGEAPV